VVPQSPIELPREAAVLALEQAAGITARVEHSVSLARLDHPDPGERRVAIPREGDTAGFLPLAGRVVGDPDPATVEPGCDRGEVAPRAGMAHRVLDRLTRKRARAYLETAFDVSLQGLLHRCTFQLELAGAGELG